MFMISRVETLKSEWKTNRWWWKVEWKGAISRVGDFKSMKNFCRRLNFPGKVSMKAVTSAMSSDGVLAIAAPKNSQES